MAPRLLSGLLDGSRVLVGEALASPRGDGWRALRVARELLATANDLAGRPFVTAAELAERRAEAVPGAGARAPSSSGPAPAATPAPVMLYFDGKDHRTKKKMEEVLRGRDIPFQVLDVTDDESTRAWALKAANQAEFPLLFIAGAPVGGLHELTQLDVNGELARRVFGA
jgi:glutaredoxin